MIEILNEYEILFKILSISSDSAANIVKAIKLLSKYITDLKI